MRSRCCWITLRSAGCRWRRDVASIEGAQPLEEPLPNAALEAVDVHPLGEVDVRFPSLRFDVGQHLHLHLGSRRTSAALLRWMVVREGVVAA